MTAEDRTDLLAKLEEGRGALLDSVTGMSGAEAAAAPAGGWSAIGIVEHVALAEGLMLGLIRGAQPAGGEAAPGRELRFFAGGRSRSRKFQAPQASHPSGECATLEAALAKFAAARAATVAFVEACEHDPRLCPVTHPLLGACTAMETLYVVASHPYRHAEQIRELRQAAREPSREC